MDRRNFLESVATLLGAGSLAADGNAVMAEMDPNGIEILSQKVFGMIVREKVKGYDGEEFDIGRYHEITELVIKTTRGKKLIWCRGNLDEVVKAQKVYKERLTDDIDVPKFEVTMIHNPCIHCDFETQSEEVTARDTVKKLYESYWYNPVKYPCKG